VAAAGAARAWPGSGPGNVLRLVLMGPPGAGKGTQGARLEQRFGVPHISSGAILRRIVATEDSDLARAARVINEGKLIPDAVANAIMFREIEGPKAAAGFVLDGYPRDVTQAEALDAFLAARAEALDAVVALLISEETLVTRLAGRLTCPNCGESYHIQSAPPRVTGMCDRCGGTLAVRADDQPDRIRTRLEEYQRKTEPLIALYRAHGLLRPVDAAGSEDEVFASVLGALGNEGSRVTVAAAAAL
jgi:adenylate kinase